mgnify:CR=1 FL=1|jgi:hypothetical protein
MTFFDMGYSQRLSEWRSFRLSLNDLSLEDAMNSTIEFWAHAPIVSHNLAPDDSTAWPTPWELIHDNVYCDVSKSLGIFYTLFLSSHAEKGIINLHMYRNRNRHEDYNVVVVNNQHVLNYDVSETVNIKTLPVGSTLMFQYGPDDLKQQLG